MARTCSWTPHGFTCSLVFTGNNFWCTLLGTTISPPRVYSKMIFLFPQVGYVSSLEGNFSYFDPCFKKIHHLWAELKLQKSHPLGFGDTWPLAKEHWRNTTTGRAVPLLHLHHMAPWHPNRLRTNSGTYGTYGYSSPVKWQAKRASGLHIAHLGVVCQMSVNKLVFMPSKNHLFLNTARCPVKSQIHTTRNC